MRSPAGASAALLLATLERRLTPLANAADAIVSFNHRDFADVPQRFGIRLLWSREALKELER